MDGFSWTIVTAAAGLAVIHTALGPDHFLPFVMLGRARSWSVRKTLLVTLVCGIGHVGSSIVLGLVGLLVGWGVTRVEGLETARGGLAAWALIGFGLAYALWGIRHAVRRRHGLEPHEHHGHVHLHRDGDHHHHHAGADKSATTFWVLFTVFVLGPCEPLIPFFLAPASRGDWALAFTAGAVFSAITLATMLGIVAAALAGVRRVPLGPLERWSHALAGAVIAFSGFAVAFLGL